MKSGSSIKRKKDMGSALRVLNNFLGNKQCSPRSLVTVTGRKLLFATRQEFVVVSMEKCGPNRSHPEDGNYRTQA